MKEFLIAIALSTMFVALGCMWAIYAVRNNNGIVILDGYEHGVAFCESKMGTVVHTDEASFWNDGIASYVINRGHEKDPQVEELVKLATTHCQQF